MTLLEWAAAAMLATAMILTMARLLIGPGAADRVVAADMLGILTTVVIVGVAAIFANALYLDVALIYAVLAFVGVIAIARAIEGPHGRSGPDAEGGE